MFYLASAIIYLASLGQPMELDLAVMDDGIEELLLSFVHWAVIIWWIRSENIGEVAYLSIGVE